mmetsp:Transcript_96116/g.176638  ORF Transcript_96116/g.176638 Transcript_96116/m.176638 type:complete len:223 (+) Transcript_96116:448-1116(+)
MCLRCVLNDLKVVPLCNIHNRVHVSTVSIQMNRHDGLGPWCDGSLDFADINHVVLVVVDEDRSSTVVGDGKHRSDEGITLHDDFISLTNVIELDCKVQSISAGVEAKAILHAAPSSELVLEFLHVRSEDKRSLLNDIIHACPHLVLDPQVIRLQVDQWNVACWGDLEAVVGRHHHLLATLLHRLLDGLEHTHDVCAKSRIRNRLTSLLSTLQKVGHLILQGL